MNNMMLVASRRCHVGVVAHGRAQHAAELGEGRHLVGGGATCAVQVVDPAVKEVHAEIVVTADAVTIRGCGGPARTLVRWHDAAAPTEVGDHDVVWLSATTCLAFAGTGRIDSIH